MKRKDFDATQQSLERCRALISEMSRTTTPEQIEKTWTDFLSHSQRFFSKLAAATTEGESAAWFGRVKHERKTDDLMQYVHQARHADEHGLEKIAAPTDASITIDPIRAGESVTIKKMAAADGVLRIEGENAKVQFNPANAILHPVINSGRLYDPPTVHSGKPWTENNAQAVAKAALTFMERVSEEGKAFAID
ncbi:hypothetical protein QCM77_12600 [Bradyrhizobium sp. SSUT18]|uniref:hypothetical protein n=1 Tax=Bradyrhizobium sp. SSUT18 TaxID=3040602 RepID=UPI00244CE6A5|nr:hypothetical protein [Bradyrhizobium sp. SSUT18]MDH2400775.1 hypothetical protein [Bradyrhizobium sp. SSUT18]